MPRKRAEKKIYNKWSPAALDEAIKSVMNGHLSLRAASQLYDIPFSTLHGKVQIKKKMQAGLTPTRPIENRIGHPTVLSSEMEDALVQRALFLDQRGLGLSPLQLRKAAFRLAEKNNLKHPWNLESKVAGIDWFRAFVKRHTHLSLRKPEGLSRARAEGLNKAEVSKYFQNLEKILKDYDLFDKPECIYNMDESGFPLNNRPTKVVSRKGKREVVSLTNVERGQNVTVAACMNASGAYLPPMVIFKGVRKRPEFQDGLPPGSITVMSESGYINEELFMVWLRHFNKYKTMGSPITLLIVDNHGSHTSLDAVEYCRENGIELLGLPPHSTHVLQPLDRTFFKSLKAQYHRSATNWIHRNPNENITKQRFCTIFCDAWGKAASIGCAVKGFQCTGIMPFCKDIVPEEKFAPSTLFEAPAPSISTSQATNSIMGDEPSSSKDVTEEHGKSVTPGSSTISQHDAVRDILPSPEKKLSSRKRKTQTSARLTSDENLDNLRSKRKLFQQGTRKTMNKCNKNNKRQCTSVSNDERSLPSFNSPANNENNCGFCLLNYYSAESVAKGDWIRCQKCNVWYHEVCVGARGKKCFICGRCK